MPGVDWQYELEQRITDMAAVLVLWSKNSRNSNNVRDEARLADKKNKLINALVGLEEPPHPFDRNNGLPIDGWDGREPHRGWGRLVQTAESFIVGAGAAELGTFMAELAKVEQDWQDRKQALALAQEAFGDAQAAVTDAEAVCAAATAELSDAHKQLGKVGEMGFSIQVLAAAKEVCDAKAVLVAEADAAHRTARAKLAEASRKLKRCTSALQEPSRELPAEPITPISPKPKPPEPVSSAVVERVADDERRADAQRQIEAEKLEREKLEEEAKAKAEADRVEQAKRDAEAEKARLDALAEAQRKAEDERIEQEQQDAERLRLEEMERRREKGARRTADRQDLPPGAPNRLGTVTAALPTHRAKVLVAVSALGAVALSVALLLSSKPPREVETPEATVEANTGGGPDEVPGAVVGAAPQSLTGTWSLETVPCTEASAENGRQQLEWDPASGWKVNGVEVKGENKPDAEGWLKIEGLYWRVVDGHLQLSVEGGGDTAPTIFNRCDG